jgi:hypothetical protein
MELDMETDGLSYKDLFSKLHLMLFCGLGPFGHFRQLGLKMEKICGVEGKGRVKVWRQLFNYWAHLQES